MSEKTTPSSHPSAQPPPDVEPYYTEIAMHAQRMTDEREEVPTLPEVPPLPPPVRAASDREGWLVRACILIACLFFVALGVMAFTCQRR